MKSITIAGRLGKDATLRRTQDGDPVLGFSVAVEHRAGKEKSTMWFECAIWGKRGESLAQYLTKGTCVAVTGDFWTREYEGKTYLQVRVTDVTMLGGGEKSGGQAADSGQSFLEDLGDEIPFAIWGDKPRKMIA